MATRRQVEKNFLPLRVSKDAVERHWAQLLGGLNKILPEVGRDYLFEPSALRGASADLFSQAFRREKAHRERGVSAPVVPLLESAPANIRYWLSLHQEWREDPTPRSQKLVYHTTGLTVFFGEPENDDKLQLFRAEWAGVRMQSEKVFVFEAPGAGHPHWQFDVYESRASEVEEERKRLADLGRALDEMFEEEEFGEMVMIELSPEKIITRNACMRRLTRMHFASCATWSKNPWDGDDTQTKAHAEGPASLTEIQNWVISTLIYISREQGR